MKQLLITGFILFMLAGCSEKNSTEIVLPSPDGHLRVYFNLNGGEPYYLVYYDDDILVGWSKMGVERPEIKLTENLTFCNRSPIDEADEIYAGKLNGLFNTDSYNEKEVCLSSKADPGAGMVIFFRAYDQGIAFRYVLFDENKVIKTFDDQTEFELQTGSEPWKLWRDSTFVDATLPEVSNRLMLPVRFKPGMEEDLELMVYCNDGNGPSFGYLEKQSGNKPAYYFHADQKLPENNDMHEIISPWRIIQIQSYGK